MGSPLLARSAAVLVGVVVVVAAVVLLTGGGSHSGTSDQPPDPLRWTPARAHDYEQRAAAGVAHVLYSKSPGGVVATATRVAAFDPLIKRVAARRGVPWQTLEAIVFLESAGRADAQASNDLAGAVGLTQILAGTATSFLHMHVDLGASARLTRGIARGRKVAVREALRRRVDERFDPAKALDATARYLLAAKATLGRDDLATESYHMGIGNLQQILRAFGAGTIPYSELYFDSTPLAHAAAYAKLSALGDDSSTYLWRIGAAKAIMDSFRSNPAALAATAALQTGRNSAELVLHPPNSAPVFTNATMLSAAERAGVIVPLDAAALTRDGLRIDPGMGALAARLHEHRARFRGLQPKALRVLEYLGAFVETASKTAPLVLTSTVRDTPYQGLLDKTDPEATHGYSLHTTGYAFDIARLYRSRSQALAFQAALDRLQALNIIAWLREPAAIHVTVASDLGPLSG